MSESTHPAAESRAWTARSEVLAIRPYQPGKPIEEVERELGIKDSVKLASNENPLGPGARALEAGREALGRGVHLYPDGGSFYLRRRIAELTRLEPDRVFIGNGTTEILQLLASALIERGTSAVMSAQAFVMYRLAVQAAGGEAIEVPLDPEERHDLVAMRAAIRPDTRIVFVANPNNPTGTYVSRTALEEFLVSLPPGVVAVIDEAYREYVEAPDYPDAAEALRRGVGGPVLVLRTFSKIHGLAGMRVGYALGAPPLLDVLDRLRSPFNVTSVGQAMALAALDDDEHVKHSLDHNRRELAFLGAELAARGFRFTPSVANFLLVEVGGNAGEAFHRLLQEGVITRPMDGYGFPTRLRVSIGTREGNLRLLRALDAIR